jgi:hypothetical protein
MSFYHVYVQAPGTENLMLRAVAADLPTATRHATCFASGRPLPPEARAINLAVPGVITGLPVWVRNKPGGQPVIMITEHTSEEAAGGVRRVTSASEEARVA